DSIVVENGHVVFEESGGSSWRWSHRDELALDSLRVTRSRWGGLWTNGPNISEGSWDWEKFAGEEHWFSPTCDANGSPPDQDAEVDRDPRYPSLLWPAVALDDAYRARGWESAALGGCALDLDGTGDHGFLLHGGKGARAEASMRVVAS